MLETIDIYFKSVTRPKLRITDLEAYEMINEKLLIKTIWKQELEFSMEEIDHTEFL